MRTDQQKARAHASRRGSRTRSGPDPDCEDGRAVHQHRFARIQNAHADRLGRSVDRSHDHRRSKRKPTFGRVIDPQYVAMMNQMMQETLLIGTARKAELPGWQAAGKTGTSQDWRDAWFIGYTSYLVAGVWLGNDDNSPTRRVSGGNLPVEIWSRFMRGAHEGVPVAGAAARGVAQRRGAEPGRLAVASPRPDRRAGAERGRGGRAPQPAPPPETFTPQPKAIARRGALGSAGDGAATARRHSERRPWIPGARQGASRQAVRNAVTSERWGLPRRGEGANLRLPLIRSEDGSMSKLLVACVTLILSLCFAGANADTLPLPDNLTGFSTHDGEGYFAESDAHEAYFPLASNFVTQKTQSYCGVASDRDGPERA